MNTVDPRDPADDALLDRVALHLREDAAPQVGDDALIARSVSNALARASAPARGRRMSAARIALLAAALLVAATAAAAVMQSARRARPSLPSDTSPLTSSPQAMAGESMAPSAVAAAPTSDLPEVAPEGSGRSAPSAAETPATATDLFARANEARRGGRTQNAVRLYRELEQRFPGSEEAMASRVSLGRLYLDRLGDANSALDQFNGYVAARSGALREEALVGRAVALQRLGRTTEERAAWETLLASYPASMSADRARARLAELR